MGNCFLHGAGGALTTGIPEFEYTGNYTILDDGDNNWRIKLLTSGTLTFSKLRGAKNGIDVFLVGGGGGSGESANCEILTGGSGGGSGYTKTIQAVSVEKDVSYKIVVGAGGGKKADGGQTSAFGGTADGGYAGFTPEYYTMWNPGANGGSGGGAGHSGTAYPGGNGGTDGGNGGSNGDRYGGTGQGTTTREFGEADGQLYATGGYGNKSENGAANTGDGGSNTSMTAGVGYSGGSGIVVIRNKRG